MIELNRINDEYILPVKKINSFWKPKTNLKWNIEGYNNTSYFLKMIRGRRKILSLHRIKGEDDQKIEGTKAIPEAAINYYENIFSHKYHRTDPQFLDSVPSIIPKEDNNDLMVIPIKQEVEHAVFGIDPDSAGGLDGFKGKLFQHSWDIIEDGICSMVLDIINGRGVNTFITYTYLVLI
ncbi:uncharacterized protein LOC142180782 [Nicotiana tabacum]|uniref:Uncharacterized protein LOC142180782 n=1 Tax=Nicotiana tabacum TaxID=4097 RepID=A0AC58UHJ4_TOBAC